ncbi:MAG: efflux RND transporter permease subunit, partial [Candidatus Andersenbacteria bacterium]|nr:efflux RND transporter permease subunit [Candidatus Andersenbacteria bacterium]
FEIQYQLSGYDTDKLQELSMEAAEEFRSYENVAEVEDGVEGQTVEELRVVLRREDLKNAGLTSAQVGATVRAILTGSSAGSVQVAGEDTTRDVVLSVPGTEDIEDLKALPIATPLGTTVRLDSIADVSEGASLATIKHFDQQRFVQGSISVAENESGNKDVAAVQTQVEEFFSEEKLAEYGLDERAVTYRGQFEEDNESLASIGVVFLIAILLMYLILAAQFNSLGQPFLILLTVPLALTLVFPALAVFGEDLSFLASIGVVALAGVVVNDAIVYLSYVNTLRRRGMKIHEALVEAGKVRLKPILSTTITTAGGILPLTLTVPFWKGMGITLIAGLIMATLGTLIVIPVIFKTTSNLTERVMKRIRARKS